ncbi:MAG: hypothetical protein ABIB71_00460 [Candidatus Woesearchaeota archaeon]
MENESHKQTIIMPLEEALELGNIVIKGRAMPGINKTDEYEYQFLGIPEIFAQFKELPNNEHDKLGYGIEYVGYIGYLARMQNNSELEVIRAGCLRDYPEFTNLIENQMPFSENKRTKDLDKILRSSANKWFERYSWTKMESVKLKLKDKKNLDYDETKKLLGIGGHRIRVDDYIDTNWKLAILSACPWAKSPELYDYPDICMGLPESIMHHGECKPYAVLDYKGSISLENQIMNDIIQPRNLGNGVVVMNEDRIPKYLKRTLGLEGKK